MRYSPLAELYLTHSYYTDGRCPDFTIEPTSETQRLLKNHRCTLKPFSNGIRILIQVDEAGAPFIPLAPGARFAFVLRETNPDFQMFTALGEVLASAAPVFTNADAGPAGTVPLSLTHRSAWAEETFRVSDPAENDPFTLGGRPLPGLGTADFEVAGLGAGSSSPSAYDEPAKTITVDTSAASEGDAFTVRYEVAPQTVKGAFAEVEIHNNESLPGPAEGPGVFEIAFAARQVRWAYYLVTDKNRVEYTVEDTGSDPLNFDDSTELSDTPDPSDAIAVSLEKQYPDHVRIRFLSGSPVVMQQQTRTSLELQLDRDPIMAALPNPSYRNISSMEVMQNGDSQKEDTLFQILKYFTQQN